MSNNVKESFLLGTLLAAGLIVLGVFLGRSIVRFKTLDRVVSVKGLAEKEVKADVAIWPIRYANAANSLPELYEQIEAAKNVIVDFLTKRGLTLDEITFSTPSIVDKQTQDYLEAEKIKFRYTSTRVITAYTKKVDKIIEAKTSIIELGKQGVVVAADEEYGSTTEYIFTELNKIKPEMIEQATRNAREVAEKFASDSQSVLGKIKSANQGQFSVENRDSNTPYIKNVRIVSTIEYYLND